MAQSIMLSVSLSSQGAIYGAFFAIRVAPLSSVGGLEVGSGKSEGGLDREEKRKDRKAKIQPVQYKQSLQSNSYLQVEEARGRYHDYLATREEQKFRCTVLQCTGTALRCTVVLTVLLIMLLCCCCMLTLLYQVLVQSILIELWDAIRMNTFGKMQDRSTVPTPAPKAKKGSVQL